MCVFLVLSVFIIFTGINRRSNNIWDSYYIIGVPQNAGSGAFTLIDDIFDEEGALVSYYNTGFQVNDFGEMETVALSDLSSRFIDGDPRVDPFMSGAEQYFHVKDRSASDYELFYVKSRLSSLGFYLYVKSKTGESSTDWIFPELGLKTHIISMLLFAVCCFYCTWISKGLRVPVLISALPWICAIASFGSVILPSAVLVFIVFVLFFRETFTDMLFYLNYKEIRLGRYFIFYASALLAGVIMVTILNIRQGLPVVHIWVSLPADFLFIFIFYNLKSHRVQMQEHRLFFPVSITADTSSGLNRQKIQELAATAAAVIILPMFMLFFYETMPIAVPAPEKTGLLNSWEWDSLAFSNRNSDGLVNAADYLSHAAYQKGFMYGRDYSFPEKNEKITAKRYVSENNEVLYSEDCIWQFTEEWYTSIISQESGTGLPALLLNQEAPGGISIKSEISNTESGFNPVRHILAGLMALLPITGQFLIKVRITMRRKGQEA